MGKRMDDWLRNMGDWNISRRRYYGLPLPFYPCSCGHLNVIGSQAELEERATGRARRSSRSSAARGSTRFAIRCEACGEEVRADPGGRRRLARRRHRPVLDARLAEPRVRRRRGTRPARRRGLTTADLPDHAYWEQWFPADWVSEMREQIRLWFYSQLFMSVALDGRAPYRAVLGYEKMLDETGREMHSSWGNTIDAEDAFERMGADVMRWQYCAQPPNQNLLFGFGPAHEIKRRLLTLWNSSKFLVDYANIEGWTPTWGELESGPDGELQPLDRWLVARTHALVAEATAGYEGWLTVDVVRAFEAFVDDVSNWYIRRSRRRFWDGGTHEARAAHALVRARPGAARRLARSCRSSPTTSGACSRRRARTRPRRSTSPAGRSPRRPTRDLLDEVAELRRVVELGRQARATSGDQAPPAAPRARRRGRAARRASHADEIAEELRVKEVSFGAVEASELRVKPNLPLLGPKLGKELGAVRAALAVGRVRGAPGRRLPRGRPRARRRTRCSSSGTARKAGPSRRPTA